MANIFKYFPHEAMDLVFQKDGFCGLKCSYPKDYNDPFELFLSMDLTVPTDHLAFYNDVIQQIPQFPTTCFSKSPIVSPMWAHYANNHSGFVLGFDFEGVKDYYKDCLLRDIDYKNRPNEGLSENLARAIGTKKPRHTHFLRMHVFLESYFSKYIEWSYEKECRFVDNQDVTEKLRNNNILFVPCEFVSSIIIGSNFPTEKIDPSHEISQTNNMNWFQLKIGKSVPEPYMQNENNDVFTFSNDEIILAPTMCESCSEPLQDEEEFCPWCRITDAHKSDAASINPYRILDHYGLLEGYFEGMKNIEK